MTTISIKKTHHDAVIPKYQTKGSAGFDLHSVVDITIQPGDWALVDTGLSFAIPHGFEGQVRARSGLAAKHGISMVNGVGTIDSDYRGTVHGIVLNNGRSGFKISKGDRIAQMLICAVKQVELVEVDVLPETERGEGGFGSTGK